MRTRGKGKRGDGPPMGVVGALAAVGVALVGYGVWQSMGGGSGASTASAPANISGPTAPDADAAGGAGAAPPGGGTAVTPGALTLDVDAPASTSTASGGAPCAGCDVVMITVCSLRRDFVGIYGEHPGLTPAIDSIAEGGYHFSHAYSASNFTLAGLTAILTGRFGSSTGVTGWDKGLTKDVPVLPEVLGIYGYRTAAFTIDAPSGFRPDYGLHRGFQHMEIIDTPRDTPDGRWRKGEPGEGGMSAQPVVDWLAKTPTDKPIFVEFHSRSAHFPFVITDKDADQDPTGITQLLWDAGNVTKRAAGQAMPGMAGGTSQNGVVGFQGPDPLQVQVEKVGQPAVEMWKKRYGEAVSRMDIDVKRVLEALAARGRLDKTILVLVADHGESLSDHGELLHGDAYYDGVVNVPMIMKVPGMKGDSKPIEGLASHVDILPTILGLVGAVNPAGIDGTSLVPLMKRETDSVRRIALVEGGVAKQISKVPRGAVIALPWALIRQERGCGGDIMDDPPRNGGDPATCLFNEIEDPGQTHNYAREHMDVVKDLLGAWEAFRSARAQAGEQLTLDPTMIEQLHKSGYNFTQ
jgi:arylsulfatase A-like enzyme